MAFMGENCGEMVVPVDSQRGVVPAPFLIKTYQLVDDPRTDHIVSWGEEDNTFVVWRPPEFARDILLNYFKHKNFSSFVRQLNTYGFRKIAADRWEFANEFFRKGEKHLLSEIHRKASSSLPQEFHHHHHVHDTPRIFTSTGETMSGWIVPQLTSPSADQVEFLSALTEDNQRLRRRNTMLLSELTHMKQLYSDIVYFLQNHVTQVVPMHQTSMIQAGHRFTEMCTISQSNQALAAGPVLQDALAGEADSNAVKLFGVLLQRKQRLHPDVKHEM